MIVRSDSAARRARDAVPAAPGRWTDGGTPLSALLAAVDPALITPLSVPDGDALAREIAILDPSEPLPASHGGVALLVGCSIGDPAAGDVLRLAADKGYVAVVVKAPALSSPAAIPAAGPWDVAVLLAARDASWTTIEAALILALSPRRADDEPIGGHLTADLYDLADAISDRAEAAITIEDVTGRVLAYSNGIGHKVDADRINTILGRSVPDLPENDSEYRTLARATGPVVFPAHDETLTRVVMPVRARGSLIGYIWAIDATGQGTERIGRDLAASTEQVALRLLRGIRRSDLDRRRLSERLAAELSADSAPGQRGSTTPDRMPVALIGFGTLGDTDSVVDGYRLTRMISLTVESVRRQALCARIDDVIFALIPQVDQAGTGWIERLAASTMRLLSNTLGVSTGCAFASPIRTREELPAAREDIAAMLRRLGRRGDGAPHDVRRERHSVILQALSESGISSAPRLIPQVRLLLEHDRAHGTEFARTLMAHLDCFGDVRAAAASLSIHENSHRYRMRKLIDEFGVDIADPELRLVTWLQLHDAVAARR